MIIHLVLFDISRHTSKKGIREKETGITCHDNFAGRGREKTEVMYPHIQNKIHLFLKEHHQTDPLFRKKLSYIKISAEFVRNLLILNNYKKEYKVPCRQTVGNILNRLNYRLRKVLKAKPLKKLPETNAIFKNLQSVHEEVINGKTRSQINKKTEDHDTNFSTLIPFGISVVGESQLDVFF